MMNLEKVNVVAADGSKAIAMFKLPGGTVVAQGSQQPDRKKTDPDYHMRKTLYHAHGDRLETDQVKSEGILIVVNTKGVAKHRNRDTDMCPGRWTLNRHHDANGIRRKTSVFRR